MDPTYEGRYTVPVIWDRETGQIVSNNFAQITPIFRRVRGLCRYQCGSYPQRLVRRSMRSIRGL